ncbi:MAG: hypothetical protein FWH27_05435 [Planctomycetaceae bacterium]|nr:hypothetical protein [Planctomycetaceae bacterium]
MGFRLRASGFRQGGHGAIAEMLNYQHDNKWKSPRQGRSTLAQGNALGNESPQKSSPR